MKTGQEVLDFLFQDAFLVTDENFAANSMSQHQARLKELGIVILGEAMGSNKEIHAFAPRLGKQVVIKDVARYARPHLILDFWGRGRRAGLRLP